MLGGVAGLVAYLYFLGGLVMWLRLSAARLPADVSTGAFDSRRLLAVGFRAFLFELLLVAVLAGLLVGVLALIQRFKRRRVEPQRSAEVRPEAQPRAPTGAVPSSGDQPDSPPHDRRREAEAPAEELPVSREEVASSGVLLTQLLLGLLVGGSVALLAGDLFAATVVAGIVVATAASAVSQAVKQVPADATEAHTVEIELRLPRWLSGFLIVAALLIAVVFASAPLGAAVIGLIALLLALRRYARSEQSLKDIIRRPAFLLSGGFLAALFTAAVLVYLATPPVSFDRVEIRPAKDHTLPGESDPMVGGFIGRSSDGVFVAQCRPSKDGKTSESARLRFVEKAALGSMDFGGPRYSLDDRERPSLGAILLRAVRGTEAKGAPINLEVRRRPKVCGENR